MVEWLADLFETNRIIVLSISGQVFFVLGLAVALQSRTRSELPLARPLGWLAAFGIFHGFMEWGSLFVPIQAGFLPQPVIQLLLVLQLLLKALSFGLLMQFGAELVLSTRPSAAEPTSGGPFGQPWLRLVPAIVLGAWAVATVSLSATVAAGYSPDPSPWHSPAEVAPAIRAVGAPLAVGDVVARLMLCVPASVLVTIGLARTARVLGPLAIPPIGWALRLGIAAFGLFAVVGGLITMPAPFPPASVLNSATVLDTFGVPIEVFRAFTGLAMAVAVIGSLELFEHETDRILADARRRELLVRERERIGRDLHDGIIQSIYAAGLHLEEATAAAGPGDGTRQRFQTVLGELNRITEDIRSTIFDLRSGDLDALDAEQLVAAVADELHANTALAIDLRSEGMFRARLTAEQAEHLRNIVTEAFSNVLRHARAGRLTVRMTCSRRRLKLEIIDDGVGFEPTAVPAGRGRRGRAQGLPNMRRRAELLGGRLDFRSAPGRGTTLSLTMPVATTRRST